mmetsp:Transcript_18622/g.37949  ORF Transcript_18622/g.37949 Transcript_18622/m.37949 type:complete len:297 (-) Transcript_18622:237-1127(-)
MASDQPLDVEAFRRFAPLLEAAQGYAHHSGCRFRSSSFSGIPTETAEGRSESDAVPVVDASRARDYGPRLAAKIHAAPAVRDFGERLRAGEEGLVEEIERAYRIVMSESVRNAMMGMFQALGMFPPAPPPQSIPDDDCAYEDMSAALPVIAQRLYNDQARRLLDTTGGPSRLDTRAKTAAFLVDFAEGVGRPLPPMPETQQGMLKDFAERTAEYAKMQGDSGKQNRARDVFLKGLGAGAVAENLRREASKWWKENWQAVLWTAAGAALVGAVAVAGSALAKHQQRQREPGQGSDRR